MFLRQWNAFSCHTAVSINVASSIFTIGVDRKIIKDTTIKGNIKPFYAGIPTLAAMQQSDKPIFKRK